MQLVNGAQFLNITLLVLFAAAPAAAVSLTAIFPLTSVYIYTYLTSIHFNQVNWILTLMF